jgi:hypothetical protein
MSDCVRPYGENIVGQLATCGADFRDSKSSQNTRVASTCVEPVKSCDDFANAPFEGLWRPGNFSDGALHKGFALLQNRLGHLFFSPGIQQSGFAGPVGVFTAASFRATDLGL